MADALSIAADHARQRQRLVAATLAEARRLWRQINPAEITMSWSTLLPRMLLVLSAAQRAAASHADDYLAAVLVAQSIAPDATGQVNSAALSGVASDGRPLGSLLDQPRIAALTELSTGEPVESALMTGGTGLDLIVTTQVADAGRVADQVATVSRRNVDGYVRMLNPPSCSRCAILAGRWYRWNHGFQRHLPALRLHTHPGHRR